MFGIFFASGGPPGGASGAPYEGLATDAAPLLNALVGCICGRGVYRARLETIRGTDNWVGYPSIREPGLIASPPVGALRSASAFSPPSLHFLSLARLGLFSFFVCVRPVSLLL